MNNNKDEIKEGEELKVTTTRLGKTGLQVSRLCLGCMTFGSPKWSQWVIEEGSSLPIIKRAIELGNAILEWFSIIDIKMYMTTLLFKGINFFDTADAYSNGESERILGRVLKTLGVRRSDVVIGRCCPKSNHTTRKMCNRILFTSNQVLLACLG